MPFVFTLPSDPSREIHLREATVAEAIEFTGVNPEFEEEVTTLFLNKVQEKETFSDCREWTGDDRRFALFQYYLNTTTYKDIPLTFTHNGVTQTQGVPLTKILATYKPIEGKAFRDFAFNGRAVYVAPLRGYELEYLEKKHAEARAMQAVFDAQKDTLSPKDRHRAEQNLRHMRAAVAMDRIISYLDIPALEEGTRESRRPKVAEFVRALPMQDFYDLTRKVTEALEEMQHGLLSAYRDGQIVLLIPDVVPENAEGEDDKLTLTFPFRPGEVIPSVF